MSTNTNISVLILIIMQLLKTTKSKNTSKVYQLQFLVM